MQYLNTWGEDKLTGAVLRIDKVPNGDACNCICIICGNDLQARQGNIREHHFKHISGSECKPETILHKLAKRILLQHNLFNLPVGRGGYFYYDQVLGEEWVYNQKPDIIIKNSETIIHIEIAVTSFITDEKYQKIKMADLNTIEIDLSKLSRDCGYEDLKKMIIHETANKKIIHWKNENPDAGAEENKALQWLGTLGFVVLVTWAINKFRRLSSTNKYKIVKKFK